MQKKYYIAIFLGFILIPALIVAGMIGYANTLYDAKGLRQSDQVTIIPAGTSLKGIASQLQNDGLIENKDVFRWMTRFSGRSLALQAGEYLIPADASMRMIADQIADGDVIVHAITFAEGLTTAQIVAHLNADTSLDGAIDIKLAEGVFLPETYQFTRGHKRIELIQRMRHAQKLLIEDLWANRPEGFLLKSMDEAVVLASIVEKETAIESERAHIASVFLNRLKKNMRLQSDPTIIYGLTEGQPLGRSLLKSELSSDTPYNTYRIKGLPPTPIANPGKASLLAVFHPLESDDLYFVADGTGGHVFAATLKEHNLNVKKWRLLEKQKQQQ